MSECTLHPKALVAGRDDGDAAGLLDALADEAVAVDTKGKIVRGNAMMAAICGVDSAAKLHGKGVAEALGVAETIGSGSDPDSREGTAEIDGAGEHPRLCRFTR